MLRRINANQLRAIFGTSLVKIECFLRCFDPISGHGLPLGASRLHSLDTPHSVGLPWTSNQPEAETSKIVYLSSLIIDKNITINVIIRTSETNR